MSVEESVRTVAREEAEALMGRIVEEIQADLYVRDGMPLSVSQALIAAITRALARKTSPEGSPV